eukprot:s1098_g23.t1
MPEGAEANTSFCLLFFAHSSMFHVLPIYVWLKSVDPDHSGVLRKRQFRATSYCTTHTDGDPLSHSTTAVSVESIVHFLPLDLFPLRKGDSTAAALFPSHSVPLLWSKVFLQHVVYPTHSNIRMFQQHVTQPDGTHATTLV